MLPACSVSWPCSPCVLLLRGWRLRRRSRRARLYRSGTAALDRGEPERAIADLEQAAALAPQASEVQNHLGLAYAAARSPAATPSAPSGAPSSSTATNAAARENLRAAELRSAVATP